MNVFRIEFSSRAIKELDAIADERIEKALETLKLDPVPAKFYDVRKLKGLKDTFRIRIGKMRVVYTIMWEDKAVVVSRVSPRGKAYD